MDKSIAIVTGSASGMGEACAIAMAAAGWPVLMCDVNTGRLEEAAERLKSSGNHSEVLTLSGDLTDPSFFQDLDAALAGRKIGAVIHAAGLSSTMADAARILDVNLGATIRLVDFASTRMASGGAIVILASMAAHLLGDVLDGRIGAIRTPEEAAALIEISQPSALAYSVSKRGVYLLVQNRAEELGRRGARIVSISPGVIDTPMGRQEALEHASMKEIVATSPAGREGDASEVAAAAVFLCSSQASFITGCDLLVDGGAVAVARYRSNRKA